MNIVKLSIRNLINQPLSSGLSILLLSLGVGIFSVVIHLEYSLNSQIKRNTQAVDMVVGAKGSPLQLILSAIMQVDDPTGNIPLDELHALQKNPMVQKAVPLSYGDSYEEFRIVGTDTSYLGLYQGQMAQGEVWQTSMEVVLGYEVAQKLDLKLGDTFTGNHGLVAGGDAHEDKAYQVVGILEASSSVLDQLILTTTESVWEVHETHEEEEADSLAELAEDRMITAVLVKFRGPRGLIMLPPMINQKTSIQAALPSYQMIRLFRVLGFGITTLQGVALAIAVVSALSVFVSLYQALRNRLYELALMRVYGASPSQLFLLLLLEGILLSMAGYILGLVLSRLGMFAMSLWPQEGFHYHLSQWHPLPEEGLALFACLLLGILASLLPALQARKLSISKILREA